MPRARVQPINPCLWFDDQAEPAARFYTGIFDRSRITEIAYYPEAGREKHGREPGSVMTVAFTLDGQNFVALNGGPAFRFTEAISLQVNCDSQEDIDYFWNTLSAGGDERAKQCGWLKDRYGLSWQVVPTMLAKLVSDGDRAKADRVMAAVMQMKKLDIAEIRRAAVGR